MRSFTRILRVLLEVYYAYMVEYRAELLFWALSGILPFILMGVWSQAAEQSKLVLSSVQFVRYFLAAFIVRQFNVVWVIWEFEREVLEGKLSHRLLQPLDPFWHHFCSHLSERLARLPFIVILIALFFVIYPQAFWIPDAKSTILALLVMLLAFTTRFILQYTFALLSFWTERASAIEELWFLLYLFLSGLIAPLDLFPPLLRSIVEWTPFPHMVYLPAALLSGIPIDATHGIGVLLAWGGVFLMAKQRLWREGLKHYSSMGA